MLPEHQRSVLTRLRTARGQMDGVVRMVEAGAYCPDVMKQLAAVQGLLEAASRTMLRNHLETCVAEAVRAGRTEEIVDELMETLKYDRRALRPTLTAADLDGGPVEVRGDGHVDDRHRHGRVQPAAGVATCHCADTEGS